MAYGLFSQVYDRLMTDMPYKEWLRFAEECWTRYGRPSVVADLGCGTGTLALPLAASGLKVYGIDLSGDMLAVAEQKSTAAKREGALRTGGETVWLEQDMREWEAGETVDAVVSFCDCVNYLTEEEDLELLFRRTWENLKAGGIFVFDVHTPKQLEAYADHQPFVWNDPDLAYIWTCSYDEERTEIGHELTFFVRETEGTRFERFEENHIQRAYETELLVGLLGQAGFADVEVFGDFTWEPAGEDTERAFYIARKR